MIWEDIRYHEPNLNRISMYDSRSTKGAEVVAEMEGWGCGETDQTASQVGFNFPFEVDSEVDSTSGGPVQRDRRWQGEQRGQ
jgi:hypothetical protein